MTITEKKQDLFKDTDDYSYAHCISMDFALGAGIAVQFDKRYNLTRKLMDTYGWVTQKKTFNPMAIHIDNVFNLVTKARYWHKPTYISLKKALTDMRELVRESGIKKIAMPKIGCGLDGLQWTKVKDIISEVFEEFDIDILVCYL